MPQGGIMGIHAISDDGNIHWKCNGLGAKCKNAISVHISHDDIQWHPTDEKCVVMPPCSKCGAQMIVRVHFSEEELQEDSKIEYGMIPQPMTVPHAVTGEQIPVMIPALMPIGANPYIARHQKLAELMEIRTAKPSPP
jgi:hypothetical protein